MFRLSPNVEGVFLLLIVCSNGFRILFISYSARQLLVYHYAIDS
jgi:hypothetical protein